MTKSIATTVDNYAPNQDDVVSLALHTDPLTAAEKLTGKSYKEDEETSRLGMLLAMEHNQAKAKILKGARDTHYGSTLEEYLAVAEDIGFKVVQKRPFEYSGHLDEPTTLHHFVLVHPLGVLLTFTTYRWGQDSEKINGGNFYYNWKPNPELLEAGKYFDYTSSGRFENTVPEIPYKIPNPDYDEEIGFAWDGETHTDLNPRHIPNPEFSKEQWVYVGHHDCREALRHNFENLRLNGTFLNPWFEEYFGVDTFDINESKAYYEHTLWSGKGEESFDVLGTKAYQPLRVAHEVKALEIALKDRERWPQEMIDLIGQDAIDKEVAKKHERIQRDLDRTGLTLEDLPKI